MEENFGSEVEITGGGTLAMLNKSEIDIQIATAKQYPRSIKRFRSEALDMVTLTEKVAQECIYALPRDGKNIEGPSARFAEVIASAWGNCRVGARTVGEEDGFIIAQGAFHDLERNVAIQYEVRRRITDKYGKKFKADMVGVTANAACSIALRNAVLKGVPKAFWSEMYDAARQTVMGDAKTLTNRRAEALAFLQKLGATPDMICKKLSVPGVEDIGLDEIVVLRGLATAIKDGETTVEQAFAPDTEDKPNGAKEVMERFKKAKDVTGGIPNFITTDKIEILKATLKEKKKDIKELLAWGDKGRIEDITIEEYPDFVAWIQG